MRRRPYGAGLRSEPALGAGGGTFVLAMLATVVYDSFSQTQPFSRLKAFFLEHSAWLASHYDLLSTLLMLAIVLAFVLAFLLVAALVSRLERGTVADAARRYAPTLIPIAGVYFISHYFLYFVYAGQFTAGDIADPFGRDWVPDYLPWTGVPGALVWYLQVGLIVGDTLRPSSRRTASPFACTRVPRPALLAQPRLSRSRSPTSSPASGCWAGSSHRLETLGMTRAFRVNGETGSGGESPTSRSRWSSARLARVASSAFATDREITAQTPFVSRPARAYSRRLSGRVKEDVYA